MRFGYTLHVSIQVPTHTHRHTTVRCHTCTASAPTWTMASLDCYLALCLAAAAPPPSSRRGSCAYPRAFFDNQTAGLERIDVESKVRSLRSPCPLIRTATSEDAFD